MALKIVSYKIEESTNEKIKKLCELENITQADFINNAINDALEMYVLESGGGTSLNLPSPYVFQELSKNTQKEVIDLLNETCYKFSKLVGGRLDVGLDLIKVFLVDAFNKEDDEKEKLKKNFIKYLEIIRED